MLARKTSQKVQIMSEKEEIEKKIKEMVAKDSISGTDVVLRIRKANPLNKTALITEVNIMVDDKDPEDALGHIASLLKSIEMAKDKILEGLINSDLPFDADKDMSFKEAADNYLKEMFTMIFPDKSDQEIWKLVGKFRTMSPDEREQLSKDTKGMFKKILEGC